MKHSVPGCRQLVLVYTRDFSNQRTLADLRSAFIKPIHPFGLIANRWLRWQQFRIPDIVPCSCFLHPSFFSFFQNASILITGERGIREVLGLSVIRGRTAGVPAFASCFCGFVFLNVYTTLGFAYLLKALFGVDTSSARFRC